MKWYIKFNEEGYAESWSYIKEKGYEEYEISVSEREMPFLHKVDDELIFDSERKSQTEESLAISMRITELKNNLAITDYVANKLAEAVAEYILTNNNKKVTELYSQYAEVLVNRQHWRDEIDELTSE